MTINEAIEILKNERKNHHSFPTDIIGQAEGLGIEALTFILLNRYAEYPHHFPLLHGETEE